MKKGVKLNTLKLCLDTGTALSGELPNRTYKNLPIFLLLENFGHFYYLVNNIVQSTRGIRSCFSGNNHFSWSTIQVSAHWFNIVNNVPVFPVFTCRFNRKNKLEMVIRHLDIVETKTDSCYDTGKAKMIHTLAGLFWEARIWQVKPLYLKRPIKIT